MTWVDAFLAYGAVVDAVIATARAWALLLLGVAAVGICVRRRRRRRTRPDASGQGPDIPPAIAVLVSSPAP
ncbi:hypothetical protein [Streptomyces sp. NPDC058548]|uniref:hypothetical protein n=1 Tax=Streptomyces sp. NPDC058548 TaxID=3346545 RepID=UPI0036635B96